MRFSNNQKDLLKNIDTLPDVLIVIIYQYVSKIVKVFLTKKNYLQDHYLIKNYLNNKHKNIEEYFRTMIRQDNDFVLKQLLVENREKWLNMKNYYYKLCIYTNYITFIESYAIENDSTKCMNVFIDLFEELGLSKNQHKKNIVKYIIWKK
jgi:hypothetical protein